MAGIDASPKRVGYAINHDGTIIRAGTWMVDQAAPIRSRKELWKELRDTIRQTEKLHKCELYAIGIEAPYAGPNRQTTLAHARNIGAHEAFAYTSFPYAEQHLVQPQSWRSALGLPKTGKTAPLEYAQSRCYVDIDQDTADAICIADAIAVLTREE